MRALGSMIAIGVVMLTGCGRSAHNTTYTSKADGTGYASTKKKDPLASSSVVLSKSAPTSPTCRSLGVVVGKGGGAFGGWVANENLVTGALEDLQKKAEQRGADYVSYDSPALGNTGSANGGSTTTSATVSGVAYRCPDGPNSAAAAAPAPSSSPPPSKSPDGVAGFSFGMTEEVAEQACTEADHEWTSSKKVSSCSGPARPIGFEASVHLKPCEDHYCQILVMAELQEQKLVDELLSLKKGLSRQYGEPPLSETRLPSSCKQDLTNCITRGQAYFIYGWKFPDGRKISLRLGKKPDFNAASEQSDAKLRLLYTTLATSTEERHL